jgi:hypothetical protein
MGKKSSSKNQASNFLRDLRKLAPKTSFCYVRPIDIEAELQRCDKERQGTLHGLEGS